MLPEENTTPGKEQSSVPPPSPSNGPDGVDKAPGEETSQSTSDLTRVSQKGKKVDADPSLPSDQPAPENG
jgi:hypothetical protein